MSKKLRLLKSQDPEKILITLLLLSTLALRFINLGYSDYISDEPGTFFYRGGKKDTDMSKVEFILSQRKGPLQLFVGYIPYLIIGNYRNELAQRIPFAISSFFAVFIFYSAVKKITKNYKIAFFSAFLLSVNGLVTAYGRIAQYENLNLLFSFLSIWFFADLLEKEKSAVFIRSVFLGSVSFGISFLAHWDAVYFLPPILYLYTKYLLDKSYDRDQKVKLTLAGVFGSMVIILPFLIPYFKYFRTIEANQEYAENILGKAEPLWDRTDKDQFLLYNPFLTGYLYLVLGLIGIFASKKNLLFTFWMFSLLVFFRFFVKYSGLHFYNLFVPCVVLVAYSMDYLLNRFGKWSRITFTFIYILVFGFLFWQSYLLFVDHKVEYPWEREQILVWKTQEYTHEDDWMRHKTGFPHKRYWSEINDFVNEQDQINGESFGYYTNEYPQIAKFYMDTEYQTGESGYYAVGIKRPQSFANDYKFPQIKGKRTVHKISDEDGDTVVRIYRVENEEY